MNISMCKEAFSIECKVHSWWYVPTSTINIWGGGGGGEEVSLWCPLSKGLKQLEEAPVDSFAYSLSLSKIYVVHVHR